MRSIRFQLLRASGLLLVILTLVGLCALAGGCAQNKGTVGQSFVPGDRGAEVRNGGPVTLNVRSDAEADVLSSSGTGPSGYGVANADEARWYAVNQVQRIIAFRRLPDGSVVFNSNTGSDVTLRAQELKIDPATGVISGKGLELVTLSSEPIRASNEALDRLVPYWTSLSAEQKAAVLAELDAQIAATKAASPLIAEALGAIKAMLTGS